MRFLHRATRPRWMRVVSALLALVAVLLTRHLFASGHLLFAANVYQTVDWMAMECLDLLVNKLAVVSNFYHDFNASFKKPFEVGDQVRVKKPQRFLIRDGLCYAAQSLILIPAVVNCNQVFGIDFEWDSYEKAIKMERSEAQMS